MGLFNAFRLHPTQSLLDEVVQSISHLLSVKQTFGAWQKELGMDDYSQGNQSKDMLKLIADDIVLNLQTYEKRFQLQEIKVSDFKSFRDFSFELSGELEGRVQKFYIKITRDRGINVTAE